MYSIHNEGKSVVAEIFVRTMKTNIYKHMTSVSNDMYIDKLNIVDDYSKTYDRKIKMKPVVDKDNTYIGFKKDVCDKDPKFKFGDHVRISKYKNIFAKGHTPNWSEDVFVVGKIKNTVPWTCIINHLNGEEIIGTFYAKNYKRLIKKNLE